MYSHTRIICSAPNHRRWWRWRLRERERERELQPRVGDDGGETTARQSQDGVAACPYNMVGGIYRTEGGLTITVYMYNNNIISSHTHNIAHPFAARNREMAARARGVGSKDRCDFYDVYRPSTFCRVGSTTVLYSSTRLYLCVCGCEGVYVGVWVQYTRGSAYDFCLIKYQLYTRVAPLARGCEIASLFVLSCNDCVRSNHSAMCTQRINI